MAYAGITFVRRGRPRVSAAAPPASTTLSDDAQYVYRTIQAVPTNEGTEEAGINMEFYGGVVDPTFVTNDGAPCLSFDGNDFTNPSTNTTLGNGASNIVVYGWFSITTHTGFDPMLLSRGTKITGLAEYDDPGEIITWVNSDGFIGSSVYVVTNWYWMATVWDQNDGGRASLYVNGTLFGSTAGLITNTLEINDIWYWGADVGSSVYRLIGFVGGPTGLRYNRSMDDIAGTISNEYNDTKGPYDGH